MFRRCPFHPTQVSYPRKPRGDVTHLDRPLVVNPQDNRNNNTNKTAPGELPLDQEYRRQDVDHRRNAAHHSHSHRHRKATGPAGGDPGRPAETRMERGFSCTSLGNVEGQQGEERHGHRSHRGHRHRSNREARSMSPRGGGGGAEGHGEHRRSRQHRKEGEEGRRRRSKGTEAEAEKGEEEGGEGRKARRHRHGNQERSRGHRTRR